MILTYEQFLIGIGGVAEDVKLCKIFRFDFKGCGGFRIVGGL
jgi:hypothetical protein